MKARANTIIDMMPAATANPGGQAEFAADWTHRYVGLEGGWGSGKTWIGARKLLTLHLHNAYRRRGNCELCTRCGDCLGPTYCWSAIIAPSYRAAQDYDIPEMEKAFDEAGLEAYWTGKDNGWILPQLSGGDKKESMILVRTAEAPERITGWEVGALWFDEPTRCMENRDDPKRDPFIQSLGRLRSPVARFQQMMLTYTNEGDATRVYEFFHNDDDQCALYRARTKENPAVAEFYASQAQLLTPELAAQYLEGDAISRRGVQVYSTFDQAANVDDSITLSRHRPLQLALDFNIAPGMHAEIGQYHPDHDMFTTVKEIYAPRLDVRGLVNTFVQWLNQQGWQWPVLEIYGDATGNSSWAGTGESCYQIVRQGLDAARLTIPGLAEMKYIIKVPASNPLVCDRVNAFNIALLDMMGRVHWKCKSSCVKLIDDLRKLHTDENGEINKMDKRRGHSVDAEGYRVHYQRPMRPFIQKPAGRFSV